MSTNNAPNNDNDFIDEPLKRTLGEPSYTTPPEQIEEWRKKMGYGGRHSRRGARRGSRRSSHGGSRHSRRGARRGARRGSRRSCRR